MRKNLPTGMVTNSSSDGFFQDRMMPKSLLLEKNSTSTATRPARSKDAAPVAAVISLKQPQLLISTSLFTVRRAPSRFDSWNS